MGEKKQRSPQEKKRLSREKDRRSTYGNSDKAARKTIPRNKQLANAAIRRADKMGILKDAELATGTLENAHRTKWKKAPDAALGENIDAQAKSRVARVDGKTRRRERSDVLLPRGLKEEDDV